ncbi:protease adaptor protein RcdA [Terrihabitans sp. B22-R8]|uniref:protease adaptor protein RcdA n=1 Tax=Terrihabitans sp. B22-R8 TaxID=3425128 RepID=UPI00403C82E7
MNEMSGRAEEVPFVSFNEKLLASDGFRNLFREGMTLVEETAAYLDGDGREESRVLSRATALAYATESMRLTTRLMQIASWLLIQRAANDGEMPPEQAVQEKSKVKLANGRSNLPAESFAALPVRLRDLVARTEHLQERVQLLERSFDTQSASGGKNPIESQLDLLRTAFAVGA